MQFIPVDLRQIVDSLGQSVPEPVGTEVQKTVVGRSTNAHEEILQMNRSETELRRAYAEARIVLHRLMAAREAFELRKQLTWAKIGEQFPVVEREVHNGVLFSIDPTTRDVYRVQCATAEDTSQGDVELQ